MGSFFIGIAAAVVIAVVVGFGLNAVELSAEQVFSTAQARP